MDIIQYVDLIHDDDVMILSYGVQTLYIILVGDY